jgi:hypothetical protein
MALAITAFHVAALANMSPGIIFETAALQLSYAKAAQRSL